MFTGIIQAVGAMLEQQPKGSDTRMRIDTGKLDLGDVELGDSIAVNGVCLTVVELQGNGFWADVSAETLSKTTLGRYHAGQGVNLEKALTPTTRLGGHLVSGHVDGIGEVTARWDDGRSVRFSIKAPDALARYIAKKGSICVDGVSLTVNDVVGPVFELNIVPHTLQETIMDSYQAGTQINLEVDLLARYLERLMLGDQAAQSNAGIDRTFLQQYGFIKE